MKTEYIYVLGADGKPQMPTKRKRHVIRLLNTGMARIVEKVPFTDFMQEYGIGVYMIFSVETAAVSTRLKSQVLAAEMAKIIE